MTTVAGLVLAAGAGDRMGGPKAELTVDGVRLLDRAVQVLVAAGCAPVIAVVRAGTSVSGAEAVVNPDPARGLRSSLQLGVDAAGGVAAIAVLLVDMPGVRADGTRLVVERWQPGRIAVARYAERSGHPIVMSPAMWRDALAMAGEGDGARALLAAHPHLIDEVPVAGSGVDLDTPADVTRWQTSR